jgi:hypothetical protein
MPWKPCLVGPPGFEPGTKGFTLSDCFQSARTISSPSALWRAGGVRDALACDQGRSMLVPQPRSFETDESDGCAFVARRGPPTRLAALARSATTPRKRRRAFMFLNFSVAVLIISPQVVSAPSSAVTLAWLRIAAGIGCPIAAVSLNSSRSRSRITPRRHHFDESPALTVVL